MQTMEEIIAKLRAEASDDSPLGQAIAAEQAAAADLREIEDVIARLEADRAAAQELLDATSWQSDIADVRQAAADVDALALMLASAAAEKIRRTNAALTAGRPARRMLQSLASAEREAARRAPAAPTLDMRAEWELDRARRDLAAARADFLEPTSADA